METNLHFSKNMLGVLIRGVSMISGNIKYEFCHKPNKFWIKNVLLQLILQLLPMKRWNTLFMKFRLKYEGCL